MKHVRIFAILTRFALYAVGAAAALFIIRGVREGDLWGALQPVRDNSFDGIVQILTHYGFILAVVVLAFELYPPRRRDRGDDET
jgi:hypothetical protein